MSKKKSRKWVPVAVGLVILAAVLFAVVLRPLASPSKSASADTLVKVQRSTLMEVATVSGTIEPHIQADVSTRVAGEVEEVLVEEGQEVKEGQVLFRLDPVDAERELSVAQSAAEQSRAALSEARAQLLTAQTSLAAAEQTTVIDERGVSLGLTTPDSARLNTRDRDLARAEVALRKAQIKSQQAAIRSAQLSIDDSRRNLDRTTIRAPFAGTVLSVGVERGTIVSSPLSNVSGGTTLVTLADLTDLRVIGELDESQIGRVAAGQAVRFRVDAYPDRTFTGEVHRISPLGTVDTNVVVFDVDVVVTDKDVSLLRSGMSADVEVVTAQHKDVLVVPLTAIRSDGDTREITLANGERRQVKTGATEDDRIVILSGLEEGESIRRDGRSASDTQPQEEPRSGLLPSPPKGGEK